MAHLQDIKDRVVYFIVGTLNEDNTSKSNTTRTTSTYTGTVDALISPDDTVHNLAPNSKSGSSATIASGKTSIMKYEEIKDEVGKISHLLTDDNGNRFIRQHKVGKHVINHIERVLQFLGKEEKGEDTEDGRFGTFENAAGDIIHILKLEAKEASEKTSSAGQKDYAAMSGKHYSSSNLQTDSSNYGFINPKEQVQSGMYRNSSKNDLNLR